MAMSFEPANNHGKSEGFSLLRDVIAPHSQETAGFGPCGFNGRVVSRRFSASLASGCTQAASTSLYVSKKTTTRTRRMAVCPLSLKQPSLSWPLSLRPVHSQSRNRWSKFNQNQHHLNTKTIREGRGSRALRNIAGVLSSPCRGAVLC